MKYITKYINLKTGLIGALIMGAIVFYINKEFGWSLASIAALKQAFYTLLFGGAVIKMCETIAVRIEKKWLGIILGALASSIITISIVFLIHNLKGTPLPFQSTLPVIFLGPPGFLFLAYRERAKFEAAKIST